MLNQFDLALDEKDLSVEKFRASLRRKLIIYLAINFVAVILGFYGGLVFTWNYEGESHVFVMGLLQDAFSAVIATSQIFCFTLMIFFLLVYNHCLAGILNKLEMVQDSRDMVLKLVKLYKLVDDQVHLFNATFNQKMILEVLYNFISILFYGYFLILFSSMNDPLLILLIFLIVYF